MKASPRPLIVAIGFLALIEATFTVADNVPVARTSSVAEMLQLKQEHQLRAQLVKEERWDQVRQLDEAQAQRQRLKAKQTLTRMNAEFARESTSDVPLSGDGDGSFCGPVRPMTRLEPMKLKQDAVSGSDTGNVR